MRKNQLILTVEDFSFSECLRYLGRNEEECTHLVEKETLYKLVDLEHKPVLLQISARDHQLLVQTDVDLSLDQFVELKNFINRYFDLNRDLMPFYAQMHDDPIVAPLAERFRGLRLVRMSDFFEAVMARGYNTR